HRAGALCPVGCGRVGNRVDHLGPSQRPAEIILRRLRIWSRPTTSLTSDTPTVYALHPSIAPAIPRGGAPRGLRASVSRVSRDSRWIGHAYRSSSWSESGCEGAHAARRL